MTVYIFSRLRLLRRICPENSVTDLIHDESNHTLDATVSRELMVTTGEQIGFRCVDGNFRLFTVTRAEDNDANNTTVIKATDAIVQELKETIVEELQQLDTGLKAALEGLLSTAGVGPMWTVTGEEPEAVEKSRAYYTSVWDMIETYKTLYEWQITPYYTFTSGSITGRVLELSKDEAVFRGRILTSRKDASNVYVIRSTQPVTRVYGLGASTSSGDEQTNLTFADVEWSLANGNPADKPQGQTWVEDPEAVEKYGVHAATVAFSDVEDATELLQETWDHLQTVKEPSCTVEATIQDMERVPGYEHQIIRLGDLVPIRLSNATMEEARVIGIKRNYIKHWLTKLTIGEKTDSIQTQVSSLITSATHTFERLTIYKNRFHEDEALIQLNAEHIQRNAKSIIDVADQILLKADAEDLGKVYVYLDGINETLTLHGKNIAINGDNITANAKQIELNGDNIAANAKQIELNADNIAANAKQIELNGDNITANAKRIDLNVDEINAKASIVYVNELVANYVKTEDLETEVLSVMDGDTIAAQLTGEGLDVYNIVAASINTEWLSTDTLGCDTITGVDTINGISWSGHSHVVTVNGGTVTLGEVSSTGGSFNIADTQFYQDGVSAAIASVTVYSPFVTSTEHPGPASKLMRVYMQCKASNGAESEIVSELIDASAVYDYGYSVGYQAAIDAVEVVGGISKISNIDPNTFEATGWANAKIGDTVIDSTSFADSKYINVGQ